MRGEILMEYGNNDIKIVGRRSDGNGGCTREKLTLQNVDGGRWDGGYGENEKDIRREWWKRQKRSYTI